MKIHNVDHRYEANRIEGNFHIHCNYDYTGPMFSHVLLHVSSLCRPFPGQTRLLSHERAHTAQMYLPVPGRCIYIHVCVCVCVCVYVCVCAVMSGDVVYILQHGESVCNLYGKIGGDSPLSHRGEEVSSCSLITYNVHVLCMYMNIHVFL